MIDPRLNDHGYSENARRVLAELIGLEPADHPQLWKDSDLAEHYTRYHRGHRSGCGCVSTPMGDRPGYLVQCGRHRAAMQAEISAAQRARPSAWLTGDGWDASSISDS